MTLDLIRQTVQRMFEKNAGISCYEVAGRHHSYPETSYTVIIKRHTVEYMTHSPFHKNHFVFDMASGALHLNRRLMPVPFLTEFKRLMKKMDHDIATGAASVYVRTDKAALKRRM